MSEDTHTHTQFCLNLINPSCDTIDHDVLSFAQVDEDIAWMFSYIL